MDTVEENQHTLNQKIESFIAEKEHRKEPFSKADIAFIQQYEGSGGQGNKGASGEGVLYEFFTPDYISELMWDLAFKFGYDGGYVLEPSIATGRLIKNAPDYAKCVGFEINPVSARIAEISFPGVTVHKGYFETAFMEAPRFTARLKGKLTWLKEYPFSLVIGNPPYGIYQNMYSSYFPNPKFRQIEIFFMYYGLQLLKSEGLLIYLTGSNFLRNGDTYNESKAELEKICDLIDAYRLPPVFKASQVPVDIIVLRKKWNMAMEHSELERQLRMVIKEELQNCSPSVTPKFCDLIATKKGYLKAEDMLINYAIRNHVSISASIAHLEAELG